MTIEERLEKLEIELARAKHRNHILMAVVLLAFVLLAAAMTAVIGRLTTPAGIASRENIVKANKFILVDENGKEHASLAMDALGPRLRLFDENGKPRTSLAVDVNGPMLGLFDVNGKNRAGLGVDKDGPMLGLLDEDSKVIWFAPR